MVNLIHLTTCRALKIIISNSKHRVITTLPNKGIAQVRVIGARTPRVIRESILGGLAVQMDRWKGYIHSI